MRSDEAEYWSRRAFQEQLAAQNAPCAVAHQRHDELARMYRFRAANLTTDPELRLKENRRIATVNAE